MNGGQKLSTHVRKTGAPRDRGPSTESPFRTSFQRFAFFFLLQSCTWNEIEKYALARTRLKPVKGNQANG